MKKKNLTIEYLNCEDAWMRPLVDEVISHMELPDNETTVEIYDIDERGMTMRFEIITGIDKDGYEECDEIYAYLRYWVDEQWPDFCVSYCLYRDDENSIGKTKIEDGAYKIVNKNGKGKCIPI